VKQQTHATMVLTNDGSKAELSMFKCAQSEPVSKNNTLAQLRHFEGANLSFSGTFSAKLALHFSH
jgi:hypothetical protein